MRTFTVTVDGQGERPQERQLGAPARLAGVTSVFREGQAAKPA